MVRALRSAHFWYTGRQRLPVGGILLSMLLFINGIVAEEKPPVPIIFDTDIGNDVDDALALGMIHALQSRRECNLLAVTITKDHEQAAAFTDAVNTFYGRGEIPIGVCRSGVTPEAGRFNGLSKQKDGASLRYPHDLVSGETAPDAVSVLRSALAKSEDRSVVIAQVGFSTNLANLLQSQGDEISPKSGMDLVREKVHLLSIMAGAFKKIPDQRGGWFDHKEYNVVMDLKSSARLAKEWPTPMVWSGYEVGLAVPYPHQSIEKDFAYVEHHPLEEAYRLYTPPPHDRPTWDLTSVLYGVRPERGYFELSEPGHVTVGPEGLTHFEPKPDGLHRYLKITNEMKPRLVEALVHLSSQPPTSE